MKNTYYHQSHIRLTHVIVKSYPLKKDRKSFQLDMARGEHSGFIEGIHDHIERVLKLAGEKRTHGVKLPFSWKPPVITLPGPSTPGLIVGRQKEPTTAPKSGDLMNLIVRLTIWTDGPKVKVFLTAPVLQVVKRNS